MAVRNCARCNKVFEYFSGPPLCQRCKDQDDEDFKRVREYLYDNPLSSIIDVSKALDISVGKISRFIREGRLETKKYNNITIKCKSCGIPIKTGQYCPKCLNEMANRLSNYSSDEEIIDDNNIDGMRFVKRHNKDK